MAAQFLDGLFPHNCMLCGLRSRRSIPLCAECEADLPANLNHCRRCAIPLPAGDGSEVGRQCGQCLQHPPPFHRVVAPWLYSEQLAFLIHRWKYGRQQYLTDLLAQLWLHRSQKLGAIDALVPVPLHWYKKWRRGFNQSQLLAQRLHSCCPQLQASTPAYSLARRNRSTRSQSGINARQRQDNMRGAFTVREPCDNLRVAIVDDVLTTGATAAELATALLAAGASQVEVWCLARTPAPGC